MTFQFMQLTDTIIVLENHFQRDDFGGYYSTKEEEKQTIWAKVEKFPYKRTNLRLWRKISNFPTTLPQAHKFYQITVRKSGNLQIGNRIKYKNFTLQIHAIDEDKEYLKLFALEVIR